MWKKKKKGNKVKKKLSSHITIYTLISILLSFTWEMNTKNIP